MTETGTMLVEVGLKVLPGQAMINALAFTDHNVQPVEQAGVGIIGLVLIGIVHQGRDIASVAIAVDRTVLSKHGLCKLFDSGPFDILHDLHLGIAGISPLIQRYSRKDLRFICASALFLPNGQPAKVGIDKLNDSVGLVHLVPLTHSGTDMREHIPCCFIGRSKY